MIRYSGGAFGFQVLLRLHGSAVFKSLTPALISTIAYIILLYTTNLHEEDRIFDNPYPMGALMVAFSFLLTFKASFSYNRYWEAVTAVHQMHSKWLDTAMELAAFHLQSTSYKKPPAFGTYPDLSTLERERERLNELTRQDLEDHLDSIDFEPAFRSRLRVAWIATKFLNKNKPDLHSPPKPTVHVDSALPVVRRASVTTIKVPNGGLESTKPSLFLQEATHLFSLLSAVAMSTLRNDLEQAESPLAVFTPGDPWPCVDPDDYGADVRKDWAQSTHRSWTILRYLLGLTRNDESRTLYNAARPFRVIGGVSDAEIKVLQAARGPLAKVALCTMWLQEFISREHLAGSTGAVAPPIISRMYANISDGMSGYNQARKIAYIPFPFPHAQITSMFILVVVILIPILMLSYVSNTRFGALLNCLTVMCFTGLHEVSRELENPFQNVPNDVPLNNFQAQYNESLLTMFKGYHPDAFWEATGLYPPVNDVHR